MNFSKQLYRYVRLTLKDNIIALCSGKNLSAVSSAIYNGGFRKVKNVLNVQVPEDCNQKFLHENPEKIVFEAIKKLDLNPSETLGMITAANVKDFTIETVCENGFSVTAIVTAGCSHTESAGEPIEVTYFNSPGTINIIVVVDATPTENCLLENFITATEAKASALRELDIRSVYSGELATGTITDALTVCSTGEGVKARFGGPASKLGGLVGRCVKEAVKKAVMKQTALSSERSVLDRLLERKVPLEKLFSDILGINAEKLNEEHIVKKVIDKVRNDQFLALLVLMATKVDEDFSKGLIPKELGDIEDLSFLSEKFRWVVFGSNRGSVNPALKKKRSKYPFLTQVFAGIIENGI